MEPRVIYIVFFGIWMFWQYAKHLQHSSHQGLPYLLFSVSTFLNCVGLSQQWLTSCGVLSQPWPAVGVRKPDQLLKALFAFHTAHSALTQPKRVQTLSVHCNSITVTTMVWMVNQHGNGKTLHKHSGQRRYNIYTPGLDFLVIVKVLIKTFCASVKLCNRLSIWIGDHLTVDSYGKYIPVTYLLLLCWYTYSRKTNKIIHLWVWLLTCGSFSGSGTEVDWGYDLLTNVYRPMSEEAKWDQVPAKTCQSHCARLLIYSTTTRQIVVKQFHMDQMEPLFLIKKKQSSFCLFCQNKKRSKNSTLQSIIIVQIST